ncbi:hypothetical protein TcWFU_005759 [Taenia crassiceps]|uniref:UspA domain-containing protein n=1 Tax=Taenia crassiceps TaxID=6207 RepID=A0ABR4QRY8_9CEST
MTEKGRKIGMPVDGSDNSKKAVQWYLDNVADENDYVFFIHVQELLDLPLLHIKSGFNIPSDQWMKTINERNRLDEEISAEVIGMLRAKKIACDYITASDKRPGDGIVSMVNDLGIQLIVMGSRGLSTIRRTILGSVSDYVLHHAQVPVCIVPAEYTPASSTSP